MTDGNTYKTRLARAAELLGSSGADVLILTPGADLTYLTGFEHGHAGERLLALALRKDGVSHWISPSMNVAQIEPHLQPGQSIRAWTDGEGYLPALRAATTDAANVAFDDEARAAFLLDLMAGAPYARIRRASAITKLLRMQKGPEELELLRAAGRTVDQTRAEAISFCQPGRSEAEIDQLLRAALRKRSPESAVAFTIIASGPNGAFPHHETGDRKLAAGDVVIVDYGTRRHGYHSDITVTCSVGEPADPEVRKVYKVVYEAQQAAINAVRPGVACEEIDRAARGVIEAAGYGPNFLHRTGHGLGLQVHESPYIVAGNRETLEPGMVFSIEPGIYLPGRFGIRLEIIASVGERGAELINAPSSPELPVANA